MQGDRKELPSLMTAEPRSMSVGSSQTRETCHFFKLLVACKEKSWRLGINYIWGFKLDRRRPQRPFTQLWTIAFPTPNPPTNTRPGPGTMLRPHVELVGVWQVFIKFRMACENRFGCQRLFAATRHSPNIGPHEAVPEVSKGKVHRTQNKHVPVEIDCDILNTFHSISHTTLSWCWLERRSKKNYSVLLRTTQYYSVLQIATPVLLCTAKYYSSTTLYYKVLLQYYSVLQSTTPVLLCTTKY